MSNYRCVICGDEARIVYKDGPLCKEHDTVRKALKHFIRQLVPMRGQGELVAGGCPRLTDEQNRTYQPKWLPDHGIITDRRILTCSGCGAMEPKQLLQMMRDKTAVLSWSDKGYKTYVESPEGDSFAKFYTSHLRDLSDAERSEMQQLYENQPRPFWQRKMDEAQSGGAIRQVRE